MQEAEANATDILKGIYETILLEFVIYSLICSISVFFLSA